MTTWFSVFCHKANVEPAFCVLAFKSNKSWKIRTHKSGLLAMCRLVFRLKTVKIKDCTVRTMTNGMNAWSHLKINK